ncbi:MAG: hypothetical protein HY820_27485 [Acidobacteria bacterium]|nr:hypothetical protein [Acidobacteriota bacterium]
MVFAAIPSWNAAAADEDTDNAVALYTSFENRIPQTSVTAMREELDWIVAPLGMRFSWRMLGDGSEGDPVGRLAVIRFRGKCDSSSFRESSTQEVRLGATQISEGRIIPYADIYCDAVGSYIASGLQFVPQSQKERILGRALGRVVAHELYHVFMQTREHASSGLANAHCTKEDLLADQYRLGSKELLRLRATLAQALLQLPTLSVDRGNGRLTSMVNGCVGCHGSRGEGSVRGPALDAANVPHDISSLRRRLTRNDTQMSKGARDYSLSWDSISENDARQILQFLSTTVAGQSKPGPARDSYQESPQ